MREVNLAAPWNVVLRPHPIQMRADWLTLRFVMVRPSYFDPNALLRPEHKVIRFRPGSADVSKQADNQQRVFRNETNPPIRSRLGKLRRVVSPFLGSNERALTR